MRETLLAWIHMAGHGVLGDGRGGGGGGALERPPAPERGRAGARANAVTRSMGQSLSSLSLRSVPPSPLSLPVSRVSCAALRVCACVVYAEPPSTPPPRRRHPGEILRELGTLRFETIQSSENFQFVQLGRSHAQTRSTDDEMIFNLGGFFISDLDVLSKEL